MSMNSRGFLLASEFRPEDYLIQTCASSPKAASPKAARSPRGAAGKFGRLRVVLPAEAPAKRDADGRPSPITPSDDHPSTASSSGETRSPGRRPAWATGNAGSDASSSSSGSEDGEAVAAEASDHQAAHPAGRYSSSGGASSSGRINGLEQGDTPTTQPCLQASSPSPLALCGGADLQEPACDSSEGSFATTPAVCQLSSGGSFRGSRAVTPGSSHDVGFTPQQQVDVLEAKLQAEAEARRSLQRRLEDQRSEAERQRQQLGQEYEDRLAGLCRRLEAAAETGGSASSLRRSILSGGCWDAYRGDYVHCCYRVFISG